MQLCEQGACPNGTYEATAFGPQVKVDIMKKLLAATAVLAFAAPALAGNLDTFEAPAEAPTVEDAPMGGSNAAWIIPLIAIIAIAAASGGSDSEDTVVVDDD